VPVLRSVGGTPFVQNTHTLSPNDPSLLLVWAAAVLFLLSQAVLALNHRTGTPGGSVDVAMLTPQSRRPVGELQPPGHLALRVPLAAEPGKRGRQASQSILVCSYLHSNISKHF